MGSAIIMTIKKFNLRWDDFRDNFHERLRDVKADESLCDISLVTEDEQIVKAHKLVLSATSQYFQNIFKKIHPNHHMLLFLPGIDFENLNHLLSYMYEGEVQVREESLEDVLIYAKKFKINGLLDAEINNDSGIGEWLQRVGEKFQVFEDIMNDAFEDAFDEDKQINDKLSSNELPRVENSEIDIEEFNLNDTAEHVKSFAKMEKIDDFSQSESENNLEYDVDGFAIAIRKTKKGSWTCLTCGWSNRNKKFVISHAERHGDRNIKNNFDCLKCKIPYATRTQLKRHKCKK